MGELTPFDPSGKTVEEISAAALRAAEQGHNCTEQLRGEFRAHVADQSEHNAAHALHMLNSSEDRRKQADRLTGIESQVGLITLALNVRKPEPGEEKPKTNTVAGWGRMKLGGLVVSPWVIWLAWSIAHNLWPHIVPAPVIAATPAVEGS